MAGKLDWNSHYAFSLRDANLGNDRVLQQWYAMNRAHSLKALQDLGPHPARHPVGQHPGRG
jgi:hypothetical protein